MCAITPQGNKIGLKQACRLKATINITGRALADVGQKARQNEQFGG
jgi:hypothetical protein